MKKIKRNKWIDKLLRQRVEEQDNANYNDPWYNWISWKATQEGYMFWFLLTVALGDLRWSNYHHDWVDHEDVEFGPYTSLRGDDPIVTNLIDLLGQTKAKDRYDVLLSYVKLHGLREES